MAIHGFWMFLDQYIGRKEMQETILGIFDDICGYGHISIYKQHAQASSVLSLQTTRYGLIAGKPAIQLVSFTTSGCQSLRKVLHQTLELGKATPGKQHFPCSNHDDELGWSVQVLWGPKMSGLELELLSPTLLHPAESPLRAELRRSRSWE